MATSPQTASTAQEMRRRETRRIERKGAARRARAGDSSTRSRHAWSAGAPARHGATRRACRACSSGVQAALAAAAAALEPRQARSRAAIPRDARRSHRSPGRPDLRADRMRPHGHDRRRARRHSGVESGGTGTPARQRPGAASGSSPRTSRPGETPADAPRAEPLDDLLEVVEHEQHDGARARRSNARSGSAPASTEALQDRRRDELRLR